MRLRKSDSGRTKQSQKHIFPDDVAALIAKLQKVRDAGISIILTTGNHDYDIMDAAAFEKAYFGLLQPADRDPASLSYTAIVEDVVFLAMDDNAVNPGGQGEFLQGSRCEPLRRVRVA